MNISDRIRKQSPWAILAEGLAASFLIGALDYAAGYDVSMFIFYAIPIIFVVWYGSRQGAVLTCIVCAVTWCLADTKSRLHYADTGKLIWNTGVQLGFFLFSMVCGTALKFRVEQQRKRVLELERFRHLAELLPMGVFRTTADGTCVYANQYWSQVLQNEPEALLENKWVNAFHPDERGRLHMEWQRHASRGEPYQFEGRVSKEGGEVVRLLGRIAPEEGLPPGEAGFVAAVNDVTEHRRLEREILQVSEREQQRIGQDLHDDLCQVLAAISFTAASLRRDLEKNGQPEAEQAAEVVQMLKDTMVRTRRLARTIFPVKLEREGLVSALEELAVTTTNGFQVRCTFHREDSAFISDPAVATHLYRIAQEALNNAIRHGQPANVSVRLRSERDWIVLVIEDDGSGIDALAQRHADGMGLRIMKYRSDIIGGRVTVEPRPTGGTRVICRVRKEKNETDSSKAA